MKNRIVLVLIIVLFGVINSYSQFQNPIGKWMLTEHIVSDKYDSINGCYTINNVYNNEFEVFIVFDSCGGYYQQISDSIIYGSWKLTKNDRTLKVKLFDGEGFSIVGKTRLDFNKPLWLSENFTQLYDNKHDKSWGGESKYVRVKEDAQLIDTSQLIGEWKIAYTQNGKHKEEYDGNWYFEFLMDTSSANIKYMGLWKVYGAKLSDDILITEKWYPYAINYYIEQVDNNTFVFSGIKGKKLELIFMERIKNK